MSTVIPKFYKISEVCDLLRIRPSTVHTLLKSGKLRSVRMSPGTVRISEDALLDYIRDCEGQKTSQDQNEGELGG